MLLRLIPFLIVAFATMVMPLLVACLRYQRRGVLRQNPLHPDATEPMPEEIDWQEIERFLERGA